jgi:hypothetical protein
MHGGIWVEKASVGLPYPFILPTDQALTDPRPPLPPSLPSFLPSPAAQQQPQRHSYRQPGQRPERRQGSLLLRVVASKEGPDPNAGIRDDGQSPRSV